MIVGGRAVYEVHFQRASLILPIPFAPSQGTQNVCDHYLFPSPDKARNNSRREVDPQPLTR